MGYKIELPRQLHGPLLWSPAWERAVVISARTSWHSRALDLEREERSRHRARGRKPRVVHFEPRHSRRDYYPRVDYACTRNFGLIVTDGRGYFSEEKRDAASMIQPVDDGVPAFMLRNVSREGRYVIEKLVLADPRRDVVLQHVRFKAQSGAVSDYRLYALLAPHLVNRGASG